MEKALNRLSSLKWTGGIAGFILNIVNKNPTNFTSREMEFQIPKYSQGISKPGLRAKCFSKHWWKKENIFNYSNPLPVFPSSSSIGYC